MLNIYFPMNYSQKMEKLKQFGRYSTRIFNRSKAKEETGDYNIVTNFKEEKYSIIWRIENIHHCALKCKEFLESCTFSTRSCSEVKWTLRLYPRGRKTDKLVCDQHKSRSTMNKHCEMAGLFIHRLSENPGTSSFKCRLSYKRDLLNNSLYFYNEEGFFDIKMDYFILSSEYGIDNLFCTESLETPQTLIVKCDIYITSVHNRGASGNFVKGLLKSDSLCQDLKSLYESGEFSDVTLQAREESFPAHKALLASRSEVFAAMFRHDMKETKTNVVDLEDEPEVLSSLLQYIYTGSIKDFNMEKAISLYPVANKYLLEELKKWCIDILLANMKVENVCQIAVLADMYPDRKLKEAALSMFRNYTSDIFKRKEWQKLVRDTDRRVLVSDILQAVSADFTTDAATSSSHFLKE